MVSANQPLSNIEICAAPRTPTSPLLATHHLALAGHSGAVPLRIPNLLARIRRLRRALLAAPWPRHGAGHQRDGVRAGLVPGVLGGQLPRDDGARGGVRERGDGARGAVDGAVARVLGHHQRVDGVLQRRAGAAVLRVGAGVAAAPRRARDAPDPLRPALRDGHEYCRTARLDRRRLSALPAVLLLHALADRARAEGCAEGEGALCCVCCGGRARVLEDGEAAEEEEGVYERDLKIYTYIHVLYLYIIYIYVCACQLHVNYSYFTYYIVRYALAIDFPTLSYLKGLYS